MRSKHTLSDRHALLAEFRTEVIHQRFRIFRRRCAREGWPSPSPKVCQEGELADDQHAAADVRNRSVHLHFAVYEDPQSWNLCHERLNIGRAIARRDTDENHHPSTDLTCDDAINHHTGLGHPLDHCAHTISTVLLPVEPTLAAMIRTILLSVARGFVMGAADIVPGVSGGTIALIFGIYERLISSIRAGSSALGNLMKLDFTGFKRWMGEVDWLFIIPLGTGILLAVIALANILQHLLEEQAVLMSALFMGLVAGSIVVAWAMLKNRDALHIWIAIAAGIATFIALGLRGGTSEDTVGQVLDPQLWAFFLAGAIAICAMILPGISGSFILVLLGMYGPLLNAVTTRDFLALAVFMVGAIIGLALFSQILYRALRLHHDTVIALLVGLMAGSLRILWPWPDGVESTALGAPDSDIVLAVIIAVTAFALVIITARFAQRLEASDQEASSPA